MPVTYFNFTISIYSDYSMQSVGMYLSYSYSIAFNMLNISGVGGLRQSHSDVSGDIIL